MLLVLGVGCASPTTALDRASDKVKDVVADIEAADPPASYRFTYTAISPLFMACLSGVEDVNGVVDAQHSVMTLTTLQRPGDVYSLDGEVLIHGDLLDLVDSRGGNYARVRIDATTDASSHDRLADALGPSLSALVARGAWPNHPSDTVLALIPVASSIASIEPDRPSQRSIRIVLEAAAYTDQIEGAAGPGSDVAPIVDVHVGVDGTVQRLVARLPNPEDPETVSDHSAGYAMDFAYDPQLEVDPPDPGLVFDIAAEELPPKPAPIPCQVEQ